VLPYKAEELKTSEAHILARGDIHKAGPAVSPSWPAVFGSQPASEKVAAAPRTALADWLTSEKNPLVARVYVNRICIIILAEESSPHQEILALKDRRRLIRSFWTISPANC